MEAIIFIGLQASGKSTFYRKNFLNSHSIISNDLLNEKNTNSRLLEESKLIDDCLKKNINMLFDNTNYSIAKRKEYIDKIKPHNYKIIGYYFKMNVPRSIKWNQLREPAQIVPKAAIYTMSKKIELPSLSEGYNELYYIDYKYNKLIVEHWGNKIRSL